MSYFATRNFHIDSQIEINSREPEDFSSEKSKILVKINFDKTFLAKAESPRDPLVVDL